MWGDDPAYESFKDRKLSLEKEYMHIQSYNSFPLSSRISINGINNGGVTFRDRSTMNIKVSSNETTTGWWGTISKTTDGGNTFTTVFSSDINNDYYYFNSIACASENICVAVAEGDDAINGGYLVQAYVTNDGGSNWKPVLNKDNVPDNTVSIMGAAWVSETEGWLGATTKVRTQLNAVFFHTTDGGATYTVEQTLENCFLMDMTFANGVGYASCSTSSGSNGYVAMYI